MRTTDRRGYRPASFVSGSVLGVTTYRSTVIQIAVQRDNWGGGSSRKRTRRPSIWDHGGIGNGHGSKDIQNSPVLE
jgi:hypothetical protein